MDTFTRQDEMIPRYARMVPFEEIADPKNDFNLNLPRYIDSTEPEDLQDIDGHLRGGIPERDIDDALAALLEDPARACAPPCSRTPAAPATAQTAAPRRRSEARHLRPRRVHRLPAMPPPALFAKWQKATTPRLKGFAKDGHPKPLIETIAEDLLATFKTAPLLDAYDIYQHLMDYWAETMQDDCYLIAADGWKAGAQPREIVQVKNKDKQTRLAGTARFQEGQAPLQVGPHPGGASRCPLLCCRAGCHRHHRSRTRSASSSNSTRNGRSKAARRDCLRRSSRARARSRRSPPRP